MNGAQRYTRLVHPMPKKKNGQPPRLATDRYSLFFFVGAAGFEPAASTV